MTGDAQDQVGTIFANAIGLDRDQREDYLVEACAGQQELLAQVRSLLASLELAGEAGFMDRPTGGACGDIQGPSSDPAGERIGDTIGTYRLMEKIGEGGFGTVYMAEQREPIRRRVALKIIKLGMDTRQVIARFEAERQALAMMDHPGIARVYDAGATATGRPYFVMELVRGEPITLFCDRRGLSVAGRLELFQRVCSAVQHAHQKGVIHRDIKPGNVLVIEEDGRPTPKVIDFGIAKATEARLTEKTMFTEFRQFVGTPAYMSPEQAGLAHGDIDTRSDVYSLGVLLYELLTGVTPFDTRSMLEAGYGEIQRIIREVTPPKPSTRLSTSATIAQVAGSRGAEPKKLGTLVRGDLDWIVMKALEKDRARRYETPSAFAADIGRYLRQDRVEATPPTAAYAARKFIRRHRVAFVFGSALLAALTLGLFGTTAFALRAQHLGKIAAAEAAAARVELDRATEIKALLAGMLSSISPEVAMGRDTTVIRSLLDSAGARINEGQIRDELVRAEIATTVAQVYVTLGDAGAATPFAEQAFAIRLDRLGPDHADTTATRTVLADIAVGLGDLARAEWLFAESVERLTRTLGPDDRLTLNTRLALLDARGKMGPNPALSDDLAALIEAARVALGEHNPITLAASHARANNFSRSGRPEEAINILMPLLDTMRSIRGDDHPETILAISNLGTNLVMAGRMTDAEPLIRESIERSRRVFGDKHPGIPATMNNLGFLLLRQGRAEEALVVARESVAMQAATLSPDHPAMIATRVNLGSLLASTGRYAEAAESMRETLETSRRVLGPHHPNTLRLLNNLGGVLIQEGRPAEALPILEETLRLKQSIVGEEHPDTVRSIVNLATVRLQTGDLDAAAELFARAYAIRSATLADTNPDRIRAAAYLAPVLMDLGRTGEAVRIVQAELPGARAAWAASAPCELGEFLSLVGRAMIRAGDAAQGLVIMREAVATCPAGPDETDGRSKNIARSLADLLDTLGQPDEAAAPRALASDPAP